MSNIEQCECAQCEITHITHKDCMYIAEIFYCNFVILQFLCEMFLQNYENEETLKCPPLGRL